MMKQGRIIAIAGGEIGRPGTEIETESIDKYIVSTASKLKPVLLFLPTASSDNVYYTDVVKNYFGRRLGCEVRVLNLLSETNTISAIKNAISAADIIYVGGGNTYLLMKAWKKHGIIPLLKDALKAGKTLAGVSAGAVCWFKYAFSDYKSFLDPKDKSFSKLSCTGIFPSNLIISPHQIAESTRLFELMHFVKERGGVGLAVEDFVAIEIVNDTYRLITARPDVFAYKVYRAKGGVEFKKLIPASNFQLISELVTKSNQ